MYRRLGRRFGPELEMWGVADDIHMMTIATFGVGSSGVAAIQELCLMPVTRQWLPAESGYEKQLLDRLVGQGRRFVRALRYNVPRHRPMPTAVLIDCGASLQTLCIDPQDLASGDSPHAQVERGEHCWVWRPLLEAMPALPPALERTCCSP